MAAYDPNVLRTIVAEGRRMGAGPKHLLAAVETGLVESNLRNLPGGDADSQGWRQERASLYPDPRNVVASARRFFREARQFDHPGLSAGDLAARVQRPAAQYRGRYHQRRSDALALLHGAGGGGGASPGVRSQGGRAAVSSVSSGPQSTAPDFGDAQTLLPLLKAMQGQPQPRASAPLQAPAFSAQAALPGGYQMPVSGGGPAPKPDMNALLSAVQTVGGAVPQSQVQSVGGQQLSVQSGGGGSVGRATSAGRAAAAGGKVKITGPNPGRIRPEVRNFMGEISAVRGGKPVVGSDGTGHSYRTVNGTVSEHSTGQASDIPSRGRELINLGQAALIAAGMPRAQARRQTGGLFNVNRGGRRYQIIFNTQEGGDHTDHLHVGVSRRR